jgi:alkylation response protein AidB-like acyl-CoA dehydrogenase
LIDLKLPGIEIRPIKNLAGREDFNEVIFSDCVVPDDMMVGQEGNGWSQVTSELGYERSGPERFLNTFKLLREVVRAIGPDPTDAQAEAVGRLLAHLITLRQLSLSVAGMLQAGRSPGLEASMVKDLGTGFEQELPNIMRSLMDERADRTSQSRVSRALGHAILSVPAYSIQGGTREILRSIISKGCGLR